MTKYMNSMRMMCFFFDSDMENLFSLNNDNNDDNNKN